MGPIIYVDGSHRWPDTDSMRTFHSQDLEALQPRFKAHNRVIALRKGQMSFHHCRTVHGSDVNHGDRPRTSIALHLQDGKNRYRTFLNERGEPWHITNDDLCRKDPNGFPDYTDPAAFPVLWLADGAW
jgi:ectoine hydroxylase-related dioxygenase (phytanoyl-CoA dioxygenase family)